MTAVAAPMLRWSSARDCVRKSILEATTPADREPTLKEQRIMRRGHSIGRDYLTDLAEGAATTIWVASGQDYWVPTHLRATSEQTAGIIAEQKVKWEAGIGHADAILKQADTVLEILSSAHASTAMVHSKLLQAIGYGRNLDVAAACLAIVNPSDGTDERVIVVRDTDRWNELAAEVDERIAMIRDWQDTGRLPGRVCSKPSEARSHFCRHAETCFEGWTPDPLPVLDTDQARQAVSRFAAAKEQERELKLRLAEAETRRREAQQQVADLDLPAGDTLVGPYRLRRIAYKGREQFKLPLAREDSRFDPNLLAEFVSVGEPYSVFHVDRVSNEPENVDDDFGPVPF